MVPRPVLARVGLSLLILQAGVYGCRQLKPEAPKEPEPPRAAGISGGAGPIHVDDGGAGALPVVFVHSYAGTSAHWRGQLEALRPARRAVAFDQRGHGQSQAPAVGDYRIPELAKDIGAVADGLKIGRFVLVGHSLGGAAAAAFAGANPDRVAGLVLVGTPGRTPAEQAAPVLSALEQSYDETMRDYWMRLLEGAKPNVRAGLEAEMRKVPPADSMQIIRSIFEYDPVPDLERYRGPKWILDTPHGDSPSALYRLMPSIPRVVIAGTSHWPHLDEPDKFNAALDQFLKETF